jgi:ribA/ribD-fused uncharacterized protein
MELYTDGSCITGSDNERYGGAGIWFGPNDMRNTYIPIPSELSTNQYAELLAIRYALVFCRNVISITIKTDSKYSINCVTNWYKVWQQNNWKTSTNKDVLHSSVIKECVSILEYRTLRGYTTSIEYIKAHSGVTGNEGADSLAKQASLMSYRRAMDNTIFFSDGILSQFWPVKFKSNVEDGEKEYNCTEQWFHHRKALLFGDVEYAKKILESKLPQEQKLLGRQVRNFDQVRWAAERLSIVIRGNYYKFSQNPYMKEYLLSTKRKRLVEAQDDKIWGIGITVSMARNGGKWNGLNLLGKALMIVRDEIT